MKFLCVGCDAVMDYVERRLPGDGTMAVVYACPACGRETAMLANPMETRLVSGLGIEVGGRSVPPEPLELVRSAVEGLEVRAEGLGEAPGPQARVRWSDDARERLMAVPSFVRGMVKRIYGEYAAERGIAEITPEIMDRARSELGLEGM
ncbi:MAG TPA: PCP reductase family protein [Gemmatimonadota bacterium]|nr:PCP reductase family protein [Gemmatimonadota bacterium]